MDPSEIDEFNHFESAGEIDSQLLEKLGNQLISGNCIFILYEDEQHIEMLELRNALVQKMNTKLDCIKSTDKGRAIKFSKIIKEKLQFHFPKKTLFSLYSDTASYNIQYLESSDKLLKLREALRAAQAFFIVPVPRSSAPEYYGNLSRMKTDCFYVLPIERNEAINSDAAHGGKKCPAGKAAQFITAFFRNISQAEFSETIRTLLDSSKEDEILISAETDKETKSKKEQMSSAQHWNLQQDDILMQYGIKFICNESNVHAYGFSDALEYSRLPDYFLQQVRAWTLQQLQALFEMYFNKTELSGRWCESFGGLLLQMQQIHLLELGRDYLMKMHDQQANLIGSTLGMHRFRILIFYFLNRESGKNIAMDFLRQLAGRCVMLTDNWLNFFLASKLAKDIITNKEPILAEDVYREVAENYSEQLQRYNQLWKARSLLIDASNYVPIVEMMPIYCILLREKANFRQQGNLIISKCEIPDISRPAAWGMLASLSIFFLNRRPDLLAEFSKALFDLYQVERDKIEENVFAGLFDIFTLVLYKSCDAAINQGETAFSHLLMSWCGADVIANGVESSDGAASENKMVNLIASCNFMRGPLMDDRLQIAEPPLDSRDLLASVYFYERLGQALYSQQSKRTPEVKAQIKALFQPLLRLLHPKQRMEMRQILREGVSFHTEMAATRQRLGNRSGARTCLWQKDVITMLLSAMP